MLDGPYRCLVSMLPLIRSTHRCVQADEFDLRYCGANRYGQIVVRCIDQNDSHVASKARVGVCIHWDDSKAEQLAFAEYAAQDVGRKIQFLSGDENENLLRLQ